jgi:geranylgeranyl pyrophosphate synthase
VVRVVATANSYYTAACAGQHLDLRRKSDISLSEEIYLEIAAMRSASHPECACCIGAILGGADEQSVRLYSEFGRNMGMAAQIANDIRGITTGVDVLKRKVTLPVIEAVAQEDGNGSGILEAWFGGKATETDPGAVKDLLFNTGAIYYAVVKAEFYKERAFRALNKTGPDGEAMARLKIFID